MQTTNLRIPSDSLWINSTAKTKLIIIPIFTIRENQSHNGNFQVQFQIRSGNTHVLQSSALRILAVLIPNSLQSRNRTGPFVSKNFKSLQNRNNYDMLLAASRPRDGWKGFTLQFVYFQLPPSTVCKSESAPRLSPWGRFFLIWID